jgi:hypothetical protein
MYYYLGYPALLGFFSSVSLFLCLSISLLLYLSETQPNLTEPKICLPADPPARPPAKSLLLLRFWVAQFFSDIYIYILD